MDVITRDPQAVIQGVRSLRCPKDSAHDHFFAERTMFRKVLNERAEVVDPGGKLESYTCAECGVTAVVGFQMNHGRD